MPPEQCPECGRFLRNRLVEEVALADQTCPGCGATLTSAMSPGTLVGTVHSVRPPDLEPGTVAGAPPEVLQGWDVDLEVPVWRRPARADRRPFPTDTMVVLVATLGGLLLGGLVGRRRRFGSGTLGALLGAVTAASLRRVWRSPA